MAGRKRLAMRLLLNLPRAIFLTELPPGSARGPADAKGSAFRWGGILLVMRKLAPSSASASYLQQRNSTDMLLWRCT